MKISEALVLALRSLKVRYVFGVSGANIEHLHDAIACHGNNEIEAIFAKSESGAAFMADAHARVHHTLGVCCSTSGGGMFNLLPGIAEAYAESVPLLALIGQPPLALEGRGSFQDSSLWSGAPNASMLLQSTTKWTYKLERAADFWIGFAEAIRQAYSDRQGPVAFLIPRDLYDQEVAELDALAIQKWRKDTAPPAACEFDIDRFSKALTYAEKPVFILGQGVIRSSDPSAVTNFAQNIGIPTATTLSARQLMPFDAPNFLGMIGAAGQPSAHDYVCEEADFIIAIGTGLSMMSRGSMSPVLGKKRILAVNVSPEAILRFAPQAEVIRADAGQFFQAISKDKRFSHFNFKIPEKYERNVLSPQDAPYTVGDFKSGQDLRQSNAIALIESIYPQNGHLLFDAGNCAAAALHWTQVPHGSSSTIALGMGTMGYTVGGAIGAQLGSSKGTRTISILGDGSFLMSGLEIHTAIELQLPILYVVFNNAGHGMCVTRQQIYFEGRKICSTYHDFSAGEIVKGLAGDYPCFVASVETLQQLESALSRYRDNLEIPGILEVRNYKEEWPPFAPFYKTVGPVIKSKGLFSETLSTVRDAK